MPEPRIGTNALRDAIERIARQSVLTGGTTGTTSLAGEQSSVFSLPAFVTESIQDLDPASETFGGVYFMLGVDELGEGL